MTTGINVPANVLASKIAMDVATARAQQDAEPTQRAPQKRVFKSAQHSMQMMDPRGNAIVFVGGRYFTDDLNIIKYLDQQIAQGIPGIYVDADEEFYNPDIHDPIASLKHKIRQQLLEEMKLAAGNPMRDMGSSVQPRMSPASSVDIASVSIGSGQSVPVIAAKV
jgi:hypothetical protein